MEVGKNKRGIKICTRYRNLMLKYLNPLINLVTVFVTAKKYLPFSAWVAHCVPSTTRRVGGRLAARQVSR